MAPEVWGDRARPAAVGVQLPRQSPVQCRSAATACCCPPHLRQTLLAEGSMNIKLGTGRCPVVARAMQLSAHTLLEAGPGSPQLAAVEQAVGCDSVTRLLCSVSLGVGTPPTSSASAPTANMPGQKPGCRRTEKLAVLRGRPAGIDDLMAPTRGCRPVVFGVGILGGAPGSQASFAWKILARRMMTSSFQEASCSSRNSSPTSSSCKPAEVPTLF